MRTIALSLFGGLLLTTVLLWFARLNSTVALGLLPFYLLGVWASGNAHAPNELVVYVAMFVFFTGIVFVLVKTAQVLFRTRR